MAKGAGRRSAQVVLPPSATSPARARRFVAEALRGWGVDGGDDALLLVSELVTNGLLHARTPITVRVAEDGPGAVRLAVSDESPQELQQRHFSDESGTGRGLRLLDALALEWGVTAQRSGKTVWCRVPTDGAAAYAGFDVDSVDAL